MRLDQARYLRMHSSLLKQSDLGTVYTRLWDAMNIQEDNNKNDKRTTKNTCKNRSTWYCTFRANTDFWLTVSHSWPLRLLSSFQLILQSLKLYSSAAIPGARSVETNLGEWHGQLRCGSTARRVTRPNETAWTSDKPQRWTHMMSECIIWNYAIRGWGDDINEFGI